MGDIGAISVRSTRVRVQLFPIMRYQVPVKTYIDWTIHAKWIVHLRKHLMTQKDMIISVFSTIMEAIEEALDNFGKPLKC